MSTVPLDAAAERPAPAYGGSRVVLFDLDRTLVPGSSLVQLVRAMVAARLLGHTTLATAVMRNLCFRVRGASDQTAESARQGALRMIAGMDQARVSALIPAVVQAVVAAMPDGARQVVEQHRAAGDRTVVLSASPHELVCGVARELGLSHGVGTRAEVIDGKFTGRLDGPFCYGPGKLARLIDELGTGLDLARAVAYADSASDLPVLSAVGQPIAVNPDKRLRAVARTAGWPVVHFAEPR